MYYYKLPDELQKDVQSALEDWRKVGKVRRLWGGRRSHVRVGF